MKASAEDAQLVQMQKRPERSQLVLAIRQFRQNRLAAVGFVMLLGLVSLVLLAPTIAPYDPILQDLSNATQPPNRTHFFGTDHFGRDVLSRILFGARISLFVGLISVGVAIVSGVPIGLAAGYFGGWLDNLLMRIMDAFLTFPPLLLAIALMGSLGPEIQNVMLALGVVNMPRFARLVRGSVLSAKENLYVEAARAIGVQDLWIAARHVLPNVVGPLLVQITVGFASAILSEAGLSFLGLGVQPPTPSWGRDLSEARRYMQDAPWLVIIPAMAIMISVLSINFIGDGLRDALDPHYRTRK